jgi:hypothetical protein
MAVSGKRGRVTDRAGILTGIAVGLVGLGTLLTLQFPDQMQMLQHAVNPYWPSIVGFLLPVLLVIGVWYNWFAQLSDILNPNSAAERRRPWFRIGHVRFTANWMINILVTLLVWSFLLYVVAATNYLQAQAGGRPGPRDPHRLWVLHWLNGDNPHVEIRFFRMVLWTWLFGSLAQLWSVATLYRQTLSNRRHQRDLLTGVDVHGAAMLGTCSLLLLLSMTVTVWGLGLYSNIEWFLALLPWLPVLLVILVLFSRWTWTEGGKGLFNQHVNPKSTVRLPTMKLLDVEPAPPKSQAVGLTKTDAEPRRPGPLEPVVILCASGGGSRAALFTAGILSRMWWQPVGDCLLHPQTLPNLSPEDAALIRDSEGRQCPGRLLLQHADVISSVSGGSLASAYLMDALYRHMRDNPCGADGRPLGPYTARQSALQAFFEATDDSALRPPITWYGKPAEPTVLRDWWTAPPIDSDPLSVEFERIIKQIEQNPFINAMRQDHLAAAITGFLLPWMGRGPALEAFWEGSFQWCRGPGESRLLSDYYEAERDGRLPALVLNSTLARTATRIAITNLDPTQFQGLYKFGPRVDARSLGEESLICPDGKMGSASDRAERRYDPLPAQINTLNDLDPFWAIPLKTAVRASANFPVGFPLLRFLRRTEAGCPMEYQGRPDVLELSDGGVIDNTGVDAAMALIRANREAIKERGVLIFQINSGELPCNPGPTGLDFLLHNVMEVKNALWRANINLQSTLASLYLDELRELAGDSVKAVKGRLPSTKDQILGFAGPKFAFFSVRAGELIGDHVMTSWHLNYLQRVGIYNLMREPQHGEAILRAAEWLGCPAARGEMDVAI